MPEDRAGESREHPLVRPGARVVLIDADDRVLLIRSEWDGRWLWFTPGGALNEGESAQQAAARELTEETGLDPDAVEWGPCVWHREWVWFWAKEQRWYDTREDFYVARLSRRGEPVEPQGEDDEEVLALGEARWWPVEELQASREPCSPVRLPTLLQGVVTGEYPDPPEQIAE